MLQEILPPDPGRAVTATSELRPHWTSVEAFVAHVDDVDRPEGYRLVGRSLTRTPGRPTRSSGSEC